MQAATSSGPSPKPSFSSAKKLQAASHRRLGSVDVDPYRQRAGSASSFEPLSFDEDALQCGPIRRVYYDDTNHFSVIFQLYGSVWPRVIPYCIATMLLTLLVWYLKQYRNMDFLTTDPTGHRFASIILSFLVVTRASITYQRYMQSRNYLDTCYKACRELVQNTCVLTQDDVTEGARVWRHNVAYRTILLLRVTMAAIEYESQHKSAWEIPELLDDDKDEVRETIMMTSIAPPSIARSGAGSQTETAPGDGSTPRRSPAFAHGARTLQEESLRAPLILAFNLRKEIMAQRSGAFLEKPFRHVNEELKLLDCVGDFIKGFHGLQKLVTTPIPFPFVQMARTFLFFFVFTMPFVLCHDNFPYPFEPLTMIFLITFGFVGVEIVCMELNDPFGDDANDFDDLGMAQLVFEDIYIALYKVDGEKAAHDLRRKIVKRIQHGPALENFHEEYQQGYSPVVEDTIVFDRRAFYSEQQTDQLNLPFRFNKQTGQIQEPEPEFRKSPKKSGGSKSRFRLSLKSSGKSKDSTSK